MLISSGDTFVWVPGYGILSFPAVMCFHFDFKKGIKYIILNWRMMLSLLHSVDFVFNVFYCTECHLLMEWLCLSICLYGLCESVLHFRGPAD